MSCTIWGCINNNPSTADPTVHYYVFPKHPVIAQQWINVCGWPPDEIDINTARVCAVHFSEDSYTTEVKLIEYMTCYTKVLKYDAVPSLFLPLTSEIVLKGNTEEDLQEILILPAPISQESVPSSSPTPQNKVEYIALPNPKDPKSKEQVIQAKYLKIQTDEELEALEKCNANLREKVIKVEHNVKKLKDVCSALTEVYKKKDIELSNLHQEYLAIKRAMLSLQEQKRLLGKVFSESQIKILSGKKKIYWSNDDMAVGYTIRHLSNKRCYMYLTKKMNIPLPAVSSIKRWMTVKSGDARRSLSEASPKKMEIEDEESE